MDLVDTVHVPRYWSEVLCYTLMTRLCDLQVKVIDFELSFYVSGKIYKQVCISSASVKIQLIPCMLLDIGLKFNALPL